MPTAMEDKEGSNHSVEANAAKSQVPRWVGSSDLKRESFNTQCLPSV
jgi:hypothetical protein